MTPGHEEDRRPLPDFTGLLAAAVQEPRPHPHPVLAAILEDMRERADDTDTVVAYYEDSP